MSSSKQTFCERSVLLFFPFIFLVYVVVMGYETYKTLFKLIMLGEYFEFRSLVLFWDESRCKPKCVCCAGVSHSVNPLKTKRVCFI